MKKFKFHSRSGKGSLAGFYYNEGSGIKKKGVFEMKKLLAVLLVLTLLCACSQQSVPQEEPSSSVPSSSSEEVSSSSEELASSQEGSSSSEEEPQERQVLDASPYAGAAGQLRAAQEKNKDAVAWLYIPGTEIDNPVMQDEAYGYLRMTPERVPAILGSLTLDYECIVSGQPEGLSQNLIIYGINYGNHGEEVKGKQLSPPQPAAQLDLTDEPDEVDLALEEQKEALQKKFQELCASPEFEYFDDYETFALRQLSKTIDFGWRDDPNSPMFGQLVKFTDEAFAQKTPYLYLSVGERCYAYEVFAVSYCEEKTPVSYLLPTYDQERFASLVQDFRDRSLYHYDVEVGAQDKILTLSTDTYHYETGWAVRNEDREKLVVMARLMGEDEPFYSLAEISPNPSPKQPAVPFDLQ